MIERNSLAARGLALLICLGGQLWSPLASAEPGSVTRTDPPAWLRAVEWDRESSERSDDDAEAIRYLLYDWQEHVDREEKYHREVVLLLNESGVADFGNLGFDFDPSYQDLRLHHIRVHRGGETLDRLDLSRVKVIQPERQLESNIYTGEQMATIFVEDLRVGDVLEYAWTVHGRNPILDGHYWTRFSTQWSTAVDRNFHRLVWSQDTELHRRNHLTDVQPESRELEGARELVWELRDQPVVKPAEDYLPHRYEPYPYVELSDYGDWAQVVDWALGLYAFADEADTISDEMRELVVEWRALPEDERAILALRFVQDELRYTGIELGPSSFRPSRPADTLQRRFGDCKDKSFLLCTLLRAMGIEAHPVFVNTGLREGVEHRLPSPFVFDHVIVQLRVDGRSLWVDPTRQHQGGSIVTTYLPTYGLGLVVRPGSSSLKPLPESPARRLSRNVRSTFRIADYDAPVKLRVRTEYHGGEADGMRHTLARTEIDELAESYLNYYTRTYPDIRGLAAPVVEDDRSFNRLSITEEYEIPKFWKPDEDGLQWASFYPEGFDDLLPDPESRRRKMPLAIPHPTRREHEVLVHLPEDDWDLSDDESTVVDASFRFRFRRSMESPSLVRFYYECETTAPEIAPEDVAEYLENLEEFEDLLGDTLYRPAEGVVDGLSADSLSHTNWMMVFVAALFGLVLLVGMVAIVRMSMRPPSVFPEPLPGEENLRGLGGWLILVGLGVCVTPLRLLAALLMEGGDYFSGEVWQEIAVPQGESYHPLFGPLLVGELLGNMALAALWCVLVFLFFSKKRLFPPVFCATVVFAAVFMVADDIVSRQIPVPDDPEEHRLTVSAVIYALIWCPYMLVSRRVKLTFVR